MIIDNFGREITDHGDGVFSVEGITIDTNGGTIENALETFNAMPTGDYQNPQISIPDTIQIAEALASLPEEQLNTIKQALGFL